MNYDHNVTMMIIMINDHKVGPHYLSGLTPPPLLCLPIRAPGPALDPLVVEPFSLLLPSLFIYRVRTLQTSIMSFTSTPF